jgi:chromate transporter
MMETVKETKDGKVSPLKIFKVFFRLGLTAFGGPAMVVYIRDLAVRKHGWMTDDTFRDGVALCQTIPGATAMQAAAYAGLRAGGGLGAAAAYVGFGLPSFVFMVVLTALYSQTHQLAMAISLFSGLQVIVVALVANATVNFGRRSLKCWQDIFLSLAAAGFLLARGSPIIAIMVSASLGLFLYARTDLKRSTMMPRAANSMATSLRPVFVIFAGLAIGLGILFLINRKLFDLSTLMLKVDLFAFGGGYASVPLMLHEVVGARHWMDSRVFMDGIAMGQVTPGPIVITATFVGYLLEGLPGALVGTISVFTPSLMILLLIVPYFDRLQNNPYLQRALRGALVSFVGLLLAVSIQFGFSVRWQIFSIFLALAAFFALRLKVDILWVVLAGAFLSVFIL